MVSIRNSLLVIIVLLISQVGLSGMLVGWMICRDITEEHQRFLEIRMQFVKEREAIADDLLKEARKHLDDAKKHRGDAQKGAFFE